MPSYAPVPLSSAYFTRATPGDIEALFAFQRERDRFGHNLHLVGAAGFCFLASFPISVVELAPWLLIGVWFFRLVGNRRMMHPLGQVWVTRLLVAWVLFGLLSLAWSPDRSEGFNEWVRWRFALVVPALWPVLDRRRVLIAALALGYVCAHGAQVVHGVAGVMGWQGLRFDRLEHRNSGWWQPVVGGSLLCAALGLHLPAALVGGKAWVRGAGIAGSVAAGLGILASGTRGAWIAGAGLVVCAGVWWLARGWGRGAERGGAGGGEGRRRGRVVGLAVVGVALVFAAAWPFVGSTVRARFAEGVGEIRGVVEREDYSTYTGARILMWRWALRAAAERPLTGVGLGGYRAWAHERLREEGVEDPWTVPIHAHAHGLFPHALATTGVIGTGLAAGTLALAFIGGTRRREGEGEGNGYDYGPAFALLGLVLAGAFDSIQANIQTAAMMVLLIGLCVPNRPGSGEGRERAK